MSRFSNFGIICFCSYVNLIILVKRKAQVILQKCNKRELYINLMSEFREGSVVVTLVIMRVIVEDSQLGR